LIGLGYGGLTKTDVIRLSWFRANAQGALGQRYGLRGTGVLALRFGRTVLLYLSESKRVFLSDLGGGIVKGFEFSAIGVWLVLILYEANWAGKLAAINRCVINVVPRQPVVAFASFALVRQFSKRIILLIFYHNYISIQKFAQMSERVGYAYPTLQLPSSPGMSKCDIMGW
jgi:hypothetical protein